MDRRGTGSGHRSTRFSGLPRARTVLAIGMVLTGYLDDGTVGLQTIKKRGRITVVQDPAEAEYPRMPRTALRYVQIDHTVRIADSGPLLMRLVSEPLALQEGFPTTRAIEIESSRAEQVMNRVLKNVKQIGERTTYTCPRLQRRDVADWR